MSPQLKKQRAQMMGYKTHAEYSLASKMAGSVEEADELSELLRTASFEAAKKELCRPTPRRMALRETWPFGT